MATTKHDLVKKVSGDANVSRKDVKKIVQSMLNILTDEIASGGTVKLRNFGIFEVKLCSQKIWRNPGKPEKVILIPAKCVVKFRAGRKLKGRVEKFNALIKVIKAIHDIQEKAKALFILHGHSAHYYQTQTSLF
jgi:nucleoid DNA-binding protein